MPVLVLLVWLYDFQKVSNTLKTVFYIVTERLYKYSDPYDFLEISYVHRKV